MLNETYKLNNDFVIRVHGNFDANAVKNMKEDLELFSELSTNIIFELTDVSFIDSSGIGAIVFLYKRMIAKGYSLYVVGLSKQPLELFHMLFLDKTLNCYKDINSYLAVSENLKVAS